MRQRISLASDLLRRRTRLTSWDYKKVLNDCTKMILSTWIHHIRVSADIVITGIFQRSITMNSVMNSRSSMTETSCSQCLTMVEQVQKRTANHFQGS